MNLQRFARRPNSATTLHGTGRRRRPMTPRKLPRRSRASTAPDAEVQSTEPESSQRWPRHRTPQGTQAAQSAGCCRQSDRTSACCSSRDAGYDTRTWPGMYAHDPSSEQPSCGFSTSSPSGSRRVLYVRRSLRDWYSPYQASRALRAVANGNIGIKGSSAEATNPRCRSNAAASSSSACTSSALIPANSAACNVRRIASRTSPRAIPLPW